MIVKIEKHQFDAFQHGFACTKRQKELIGKLAEEAGVSKGEVLRQMVDFFLSQHPKEVDELSQESGDTTNDSTTG